MNITKKAGCIVLDVNNKTIALVYREKQNDYSFPKGHLEENESLKECAIRETAEEIKTHVSLVNHFKPFPLRYVNKKGERCLCYYFLAIDEKHSDNASTDTHELVWKNIEDVEKTLTHQSLQKIWKYFLPKIKKYYKF